MGILNFFDGCYTSAAVDRIIDKARVMTKRCDRVKWAGTLFTRSKPGVGNGRTEHRRATRDRQGTQGRFST